MQRRRIVILVAAVLCVGWFGSGHAGLIVLNDPYSTGTADWLADVRFRNFQSAVSGDYELSVNANPLRRFITGDPLLTVGHIPNFAYNQAAWAQHNDFWITYNPAASTMSLRVTGSGTQAGGGAEGYDVTISRAPDAVAAGPVNYIEMSLFDRAMFPTLPGGVSISSLAGQNLGTFTMPAAGFDSWAIIDPAGSLLNDGFILQGSFELDIAKLDGGKEGDKIIFGIGHHSEVPAVPIPAALWLLCSGVVGLAALRRKIR